MTPEETHTYNKLLSKVDNNTDDQWTIFHIKRVRDFLECVADRIDLENDRTNP